jgi:ABC-type dipeptide/oligopeptide/nickel transport system ATPase component
MPPGRVDRGRIMFEGRNLLDLSEPEMRDVRGNDIAMIFQEPMSSLNPVYTIGDQIMEAILLHQEIDVSQARNSAIEALDAVGIPNPSIMVDQFPHQFSGGMRQRVMIAMALACQPKLLFSDEPTTALDVTIQAQILELLRDLQDERNMGMMLITHDLGVVAENSDVVCVMYAGRVVEYAKVFNLFENPMHPYTRGLFASIPKLGDSRHRLVTIRDVIDNPEEFKKLPGAEKGIRPWWPQADPPPDLVGQAGTADDYVLYEIEPERWVGVWNTEAMQDMPTQRPPDLTYRVTPDEREVVKSFTEA